MKPLSISKELVAASSRPMVLSILSNGESYGYEILQRVILLSGGRMEWSEGMLYPVLHRLENEGFIKSRWQVADTGRKRKYYRITSKGKRQLAQDRAHWEALSQILVNSWGMSHV